MSCAISRPFPASRQWRRTPACIRNLFNLNLNLIAKIPGCFLQNYSFANTFRRKYTIPRDPEDRWETGNRRWDNLQIRWGYRGYRRNYRNVTNRLSDREKARTGGKSGFLHAFAVFTFAFVIETFKSKHSS